MDRVKVLSWYNLNRKYIRPQVLDLCNSKVQVSKAKRISAPGRHTKFELRNRFYIGEVVYKRQICPGEQPPILDRDLFEAVQVTLAAQRTSRQSTRTKSEALLLGKIFDDRGNRMTPSHSRKQGRDSAPRRAASWCGRHGRRRASRPHASTCTRHRSPRGSVARPCRRAARSRPGRCLPAARRPRRCRRPRDGPRSPALRATAPRCRRCGARRSRTQVWHGSRAAAR
jgi:hypothetical protein